MLSHEYREANTAPAAWLRGDLQHPAADRHGIVPCHDALRLLTEDAVEIRMSQRYKRTRGIARRAGKCRVVVRHKLIEEVPVAASSDAIPATRSSFTNFSASFAASA